MTTNSDHRCGPLNIADFYPWVYLTGGVERTILEICRRSRHRHTIFTNHFDPGSTYPEFRALDVFRLSHVPVGRGLGSVLNTAAVIGLQKVDFSSYDILLVHCDGLGDLILCRQPQIPAVCFCHTPLRPVFDPQYRGRALERYTGVSRLLFKVFSAGFRHLDQRMWSRYRHVFFNSEETRMRADRGGLLRGLGGRFEILHPGIDWGSCHATWRYDLYFLVPGRIMWTKGVETAINAFLHFKCLSPAHGRFRLIVAGAVDKKSQLYLARLREEARGRGDIEFVVSPTDQILHSLYADCYAALFPAFNEDWGIAPLEANAFGKPVIATNRGGPAESQVDGETGFLVPAEPEAFARAMAVLAADEDLARTMGRAGRERARRYDWSHFVSRIDDVVEEVAESHAGSGAATSSTDQNSCGTSLWSLWALRSSNDSDALDQI